MTPRERMLAALRGDRADRVPLELYGWWLADRAALEAVEDPLWRKIGERTIDELLFRTKIESHVSRMFVTPPQRIRTEHSRLPNGNTRTLGTIDTPKGELRFVTEWDPEVGTEWTVKYPVEGPGDITMAEAKRLARGRITLGGSIEARVLCNESEDRVERAVRDAFDGGSERFVLVTTAGCSARLPEREFKNYLRLIDVWEELSPI